MFKFFTTFLFSILFTNFVNASIVKEKVENIIGSQEYKIHNSLINLLFKEESKYISNNNINYYKLFDTLQKNGLLNLKLDRPSQIEIQFIATNKNFKSYKILNDTMQALGYRYFFTKSIRLDDENKLYWNLSFKTEYMLDPVMLIEELRKNNCIITKVENNGSKKWSYILDFDNAVLSSAIKVEKNEKIKFQKPLRAYLFKVEDAKSLQVLSRNLNNWFPHIVFFNKDLEVLNFIKKDRIFKGLRIKVPENTSYIKVTDMYNLINIKRGLSIIVR